MQRAWSAPLPAHLAVLALVLLGLASLTSAADSFATDEGSYELQLRALDEGSWALSSGTEQLDDTQTHYPVAYAERTDDGWVPLAKHPMWPWLALMASNVTGVDHAYAVLGALSILLLATAAWLLAGEDDPSLSRLAFWLAGLAPVVVTASFGWAHAAAAAAAGVAVLGAARLVRRGAGIVTVALLFGGLAAGILLRTEGVLLAIAVAAAIAIGGRIGGRSWRWSLGWPGAVVAVLAVVLQAEAWWINRITGGSSTTFEARAGGGVVASSFLDARYQGATRSLFDPRGGALSLVLIAAIILAAVAAARTAASEPSWSKVWLAAMGVVVLITFLRITGSPTEPIPGLIVAWPIAVIGGAAAASVLWRSRPVESTVIVLFGGAVLATQYADGGAVQWGGRFFAPLTVPLAVVAATGVRRALQADGLPADHRRIATALIAAVVVVPTVMGAFMVGDIRAFYTDTYDQVDARVDGIAITPDPQLPRMMWRHRIPWLVVEETDEGADLTKLLGSLDENPDTPQQVSLVLRGYDLPNAARALAANPAWREVSREEDNGLTVVTIEH